MALPCVLLIGGLVMAGCAKEQDQQADTTPQQAFEIGSVWTVEETISDPDNVWLGTWTRQGDTNTFDAVWRHKTDGREVKGVVEFRQVEGNQVVLFRAATNGNYRGTLSADGRQITSGTADWYRPEMSWTATIE